MSDERITLELLGARTLAITAELHDLRDRFSSLECRFTSLENRFAIQEDRQSRILALVVRIAERQGGPSIDDKIAAIEERLRRLEDAPSSD